MRQSERIAKKQKRILNIDNPDALKNIFTFFNHQELIKMKFVSKKFKQIAEDPFVKLETNEQYALFAKKFYEDLLIIKKLWEDENCPKDWAIPILREVYNRLTELEKQKNFNMKLFAKYLLQFFPELAGFKIQVGAKKELNFTIVHIFAGLVEHELLLEILKKSAQFVNVKCDDENPISFAIHWNGGSEHAPFWNSENNFMNLFKSSDKYIKMLPTIVNALLDHGTSPTFIHDTSHWTHIRFMTICVGQKGEVLANKINKILDKREHDYFLKNHGRERFY